MQNFCVFRKHTEISKFKNHTKNAKNDISGITDIFPARGFSPYWLSPITSFHYIGVNRYYRDILESVPTLRFGVSYMQGSVYFNHERS
jgi:hypothetical protein